MRQILVDHARARLAKKRDGGYRVTLAEDISAVEPQEVDVLAIDDALKRLSELDPQQARVVELRYFGGLSIRETSNALSVSEATVKREWATARAWLHREITSTRREWRSRSCAIRRRPCGSRCCRAAAAGCRAALLPARDSRRSAPARVAQQGFPPGVASHAV